MNLVKALAVAAMACSLASTVQAATASFSTDPPAAGPIVISNLVGHVGYDGTGQDPGPLSNVDDPKYVAYDQPAQGQTFTTGSDTNGYKVVAVTLRQVSYGTYSLVPTLNYTIRITRPLTASTLSVIASENAVVPEDYTDYDTCNFPTVNGGATKGAGSGRYSTFTFDTPVALAPNTLYGFDVSVGHTPSHYWETDGRDSTPPRTVRLGPRWILMQVVAPTTVARTSGMATAR